MLQYELWFDNEDKMEESIIIDAADMNEAINKFCVLHGFIDYADYAQNNDVTTNDINVCVYSEF